MAKLNGVTLPRLTAKQEGGDDGYCYVVRINGQPSSAGLTRSQVRYYKRLALQAWCSTNNVDFNQAAAKLKLN